MKVLTGDGWVDYVPRTTWIDRDGKLEMVDLEDGIIRALKDRRFALLMGLPGIGKSTTAEYIIRRFCEEGWVVIKIVPMEPRKEESKLGMRFERFYYGGALKIEIETLMMNEARLRRLAKVIEGFSKNPEGFGNERVKNTIVRLVGLFEEFKNLVHRLKDLKKFKGLLKDIRSWRDFKDVLREVLNYREKVRRKEVEIDRNIAEHVDNLFRGIETLEKGFRSCMQELGREIGGDVLVGFDVDMCAEIYRVFENFEVFEAFTEEVLKRLPIISGVICLFLAFKGFMELGERFDVVHSIGERLKGLKILIVVDDMCDCDSELFGDFLKICHKSGLSVFVVRRIRLEGREEFEEMKALLEAKRGQRAERALKLAKVVKKVGKELEGVDESCVWFMLDVRPEEFREIVLANLEIINRMRG